MISDEQRANANRPLKGMTAPFRIDPGSGRVMTTKGADKLKENLRTLLLTRIGERLMRREYGGGADQLLYENINEGLVEVARHQIARALVRFEPRVIPQEITVAQAEEGTLLIRISYVQAETPGVQTLSVPLG